jgi:GNAT superfamily N-acetyltransferase
MEPIGLDAAPQLQRLYERCAEFWELTEGGSPPPDAAVKELTFAAPGKTVDDSFYFGVYEDEELIAFVQLLRDFPKPAEWFLGLLMLDPAHRSRGLGAEIHGQVVDWLGAQGATTLWIAVLSQNEGALRFWTRMGYVERERQTRVGAGGLESQVILMTLPLQAC